MATAYQRLMRDVAESRNAYWKQEGDTLMLYTSYNDIGESAYNVMIKPTSGVLNEGIGRADYDEEVDILEWEGGETVEEFISKGGYVDCFLWIHPITSGVVAFDTKRKEVYMYENSDYNTPETYYVDANGEMIQIY